jgi:hypothetical protein
MAYLMEDEEEKNKQGQMFQSQETGVAGSGGSLGGGLPSQKTAAGKPGQWTNIQDYLNANKDNRSMQEQIRASGQQLLSEAKTKSGELQKKVSETPKYSPYAYNQQDFESATPEKILQGVTQDYTPVDFSEIESEFTPIKEEFAKVQPNSFKSLVDLGLRGKPNAVSTYTPTMSLLDQSLLQQDPEFVSGYAKTLADQFKAEAVDPLSKALEAGRQQQSDYDVATDLERNKFRSALSDYLAKGRGAVEGKLKELVTGRENLISQGPGKAPIDVGGGVLNSMGYNPSNYWSFVGATPTTGMAAKMALPDIAKYNALAGIQESISGQPVTRYIGEDYEAPSWSFNKDRFSADLSNYEKQIAAKREAEELARRQAEEERIRLQSQMPGAMAIPGQLAIQPAGSETSILAPGLIPKTSKIVDDKTFASYFR